MYQVICRVSSICLFSVLSSLTYAKNISQDVINYQFAILQQNYFQRLDLRAPKDFLQSTPKFSAQLNQVADEEQRLLNSKHELTKQEKEQAGLILIYNAMLIANNNLAIEKGIFTLSDFTKEKRFSKLDNTHDELKARAEYVLSELQTASSLRPDDHRIDGWIIGAKTNLEFIETGKISKNTQAEILNMIAARPSFNLWTAILLLHSEDASQLEGLQNAAQNFVDQLNKDNDPCKAHPQDCINGSKAPYNFQAAIVELGDVFLRRAEFYLRKNDFKNAFEMTSYAEGTYSQLDKPQYIASTKKWPDNVAIGLRKDYLNQIKKNQLPTVQLVKQDLYQRVYECGACHGRVEKT